MEMYGKAVGDEEGLVETPEEQDSEDKSEEFEYNEEEFSSDEDESIEEDIPEE